MLTTARPVLVAATLALGLTAVTGCSGDAQLSASVIASAGSPGVSASASPATNEAGTTSGATADLPSAKEAYLLVRTNALAATSASMQGTLVDNGKTLSVAISGSTSGSPQKGVIGFGGVDGTATVINVGTTYYMTGDEAFWTAQAGAAGAKALKGKYVVIDEAGAKEFGDFQIGALLRDMFSDPEMSTFESMLTPVQLGTVDKTPAWVLGEPGGGQLYVSADGKGQLLKLVGPTSQPGEFTFTDWNSAPAIKAPSAKQVIEIP